MQVFRRNILYMGGDSPLLTKRVGELAVAIAPEHVLKRHLHASARIYGAVENSVRIRNVKVEIHGIARACGGAGSQLTQGGVHENDGIADFEFGVHDFAIRAWMALILRGANGLLGEIDGSGTVLAS